MTFIPSARMVLREVQARMLMLETGCNSNKYQKGYTLIEIIVVLIIIGISTTFITLNFSTLKSVDSKINSFEKPIILILGGLNKGSDFRLLLPHIKSSQVRDIVTYGDAGGHINIALGDGTITRIDEMQRDSPLMIFYPSGENSGGEIDIYHNDYIQRIVIKNNGKVINEVIRY